MKPVLIQHQDIVIYDGPDEYYPSPNAWNLEQIKEMGPEYAAAIRHQKHPYNRAGVCIGLCHMLRTRQIPLTVELLNKVPIEWKDELIKSVFLGVAEQL